MANLSKPVPDPDNLRPSRKRALGEKLANTDNIDVGAVKRRKLAGLDKIAHPPKASTSQSNVKHTKSNTLSAKPKPGPSMTQSRQASIEIEEEEEICHNAGPPKNPTSILEEVDKNDHAAVVSNESDESRSESGIDDNSEETEQQELGTIFCKIILSKTNERILERLKKDWHTPIYAFFHPDPEINYVDGRRVHDFICNAKVCKGKGKSPRRVRRYLDTSDKKSTGSMRRHAKVCWGEENVARADESANINASREALKNAKLIDGTITAVFERTGKGKITYSARQHTKAETRYENLSLLFRPFLIPIYFCSPAPRL